MDGTCQEVALAPVVGNRLYDTRFERRPLAVVAVLAERMRFAGADGPVEVALTPADVVVAVDFRISSEEDRSR